MYNMEVSDPSEGAPDKRGDERGGKVEHPAEFYSIPPPADMTIGVD